MRVFFLARLALKLHGLVDALAYFFRLASFLALVTLSLLDELSLASARGSTTFLFDFQKLVLAVLAAKRAISNNNRRNLHDKTP